MRRTLGLTLLEMILTMVIIATGAALAIPKIQAGIEQRKADSAIETLRTMSHCIRMYRIEQNVPPSSLAALEVGTGNSCLDPNQYEKKYNYFYSVSDAGITLSAKKDDQSNRGVLFRKAGALSRCVGNSTTSCIQEGKCNSETCASLAEVYRTMDE